MEKYTYSYDAEYKIYSTIPYDAEYIIIDDTVRHIPDHAFDTYINLKFVEISNSVTTIGCGAFFSCYSLESVSFGNKVRLIDGYAFRGCSKLNSIFSTDNGLDSFPSSLDFIDKYAFCDCEKLLGVIFQENITEIGEYAFAGCKSLTKVVFRSKLENIDIDPTAFQGTPHETEIMGLKNVIILTPQNVKEHAKEIISFIESNFSHLINQSYMRGHILPDGTFLTNIKGYGIHLAHRVTEEEVCKALERELGWKIKDFEFDGDLGESLFDLLGCIRVNACEEEYIALPKQKPTYAQMDTLEDWMGWYFFSEKHLWLRVATTSGQQVTYTIKEYDVDEIIQKINRYYNSGNLYENKNKRVVEKMARYLKEGPGAGYTVEYEITKVNHIYIRNQTIKDDDMVYIDCDVDVEISAGFSSYYYSGSMNYIPATITGLTIEKTYDSTEEFDEDDIRYAIDGLKVKSRQGGGWSHYTYEGDISSNNTNDIKDTMEGYFVYSVEGYITDEDIINYIDRVVSGESLYTEYNVFDSDDELIETFSYEEDAIEYAEKNDYAYVELLILEETLNGDIEVVDEQGIVWENPNL